MHPWAHPDRRKRYWCLRPRRLQPRARFLSIEAQHWAHADPPVREPQATHRARLKSTRTSHSPRRTRSPETNADKPSTVESAEDHQRIGSKPADARSTVNASDRERPPSSAGLRLIKHQSGGDLASVDEDAPRAPAALEVQARRLPGRSRDARSWTRTRSQRLRRKRSCSGRTPSVLSTARLTRASPGTKHERDLGSA
jgi:hypothetical protein